MQKILEVAIGLVLVFGVFSVLVSSITESISGVFGWRHQNLVEGVARMLDGTTEKGPHTEQVMAHPLIRSISKHNAPSYIDAVTFTTAFLDATGVSQRSVEAVVADGTILAAKIDAVDDPDLKLALQQAWAAAGQREAPFVEGLLAARSAADPRADPMLEAVVGDADDVDVQLEALERTATTDSDRSMVAFLSGQWQQTDRDVAVFVGSLVTPNLVSRAATGTAQIRTTLQALPEPLSGSLVPLWDDAGEDFTRFRHGVEDWFDRQMERASGWYGKRAQLWMFVVSLVMAASMNISGIAIASSLWADPALSRATADLAETAVSNANPTSSTAATTESTTASTETTRTTAATASPSSPTYQEVADLGLPVGWSATAWPGWRLSLILHLVGIVIVAIAGSFGAPVWFDLLNNLVNLRIAGPKPEPAAQQRAS
jgi:hypothetical protein